MSQTSAPVGPRIRTTPTTDVTDLFLFDEKRKVQQDRTVSLHGVAHEVDAALVGETVTLRCDPAGPTRAKCRSEFPGEALRRVMYREHVDLIETNEPVHDSVRWVNDFAHEGIFKLRNGPTGFRELHQAIRGGYETGDHDRRVVGRILTDERLNGRPNPRGLDASRGQPSRQELLFHLVV